MEKRIPMLTQPDIPNVNGFTYTQECWEKAIKNIHDRYIPVTDIEYVQIISWTDFPPVGNILGWVQEFDGNYVIVDVGSQENADKIDDYISRGYKGFMRYITDDVDDNKVIHKIKRIIAIDLQPGFTW